MAEILKPTISATKTSENNSSWEIKVQYLASFSEFELANCTFRDGFVLWEDDPDNDDQLTGVVAVSNFKPPLPLTPRTMTIRISGDALDTELGQEELYAKIRLRNTTLNFLYEGRTKNLLLSP